jgi:hypothetical protein
MGGFGGALNADFQQPSSPDPTSAPQLQVPQGAQQPAQLSPLAAALQKNKKKTGLVKVKAPSSLSAAIARSRKGRPSSLKYG